MQFMQKTQPFCNNVPQQSLSKKSYRNRQHNRKHQCNLLADFPPSSNHRTKDSQSEGERIETITATPDGGASTTVVGTKIMRLLGKRVESLPHRDEDNLLAANGNKIRTTGRLRLNMRYFDQTITTPVVVSPDIDGLLISWFACVGLGILSKDYPAPIPKSIMKIDNPYEESS